MNGNKKISPDIYCCCYKSNTTHEINCLGMLGTDGNNVTFKSPTMRREFMKKHCYPPGEKNRCPLYPILYRENEEEDNEDE